MSQTAGETNDPLIADHRNFYKVEKRTKDGSKVDRMLYAGNNLDMVRRIFAEAIKTSATYPTEPFSSGRRC